MRTRLIAFAGAALVALHAGGAHSDTLGLTPERPILESSGAAIDFLVVGNLLEVSANGAELDYTDGVAVDGANLSFAIGVAVDGASNGASGGFDVTDGDELLLEGSLSAVGYTTDRVELAFDKLGGPMTSSFGQGALIEIFFDDQLGANPFAGVVDNESYLAAISLSPYATGEVNGPASPAPIPVPASGLLMVFGAGLLAAIFRRRRDYVCVRTVEPPGRLDARQPRG